MFEDELRLWFEEERALHDRELQAWDDEALRVMFEELCASFDEKASTLLCDEEPRTLGPASTNARGNFGITNRRAGTKSLVLHDEEPLTLEPASSTSRKKDCLTLFASE